MTLFKKLAAGALAVAAIYKATSASSRPVKAAKRVATKAKSKAKTTARKAQKRAKQA